MEKLNLGYSTKNIPIPSEKDYLRRLIEKTEQFLRRMRWKAHFFLNPCQASSCKETYGFKSTKNPPPIDELKEFEDGMLNIIQSTRFKPVNNSFLNNLNNDVKHIKKERKLLIPADKTTNFYKLDPATYNTLLEQNITKSYKKASSETAHKIQQEDKKITAKLGIDDRVDTTANKNAFITLKDHKPNFVNKPTCRLINPTKSEIGKISKQILDRVNLKITKATKINQWKNTSSVIKWFNLIDNKEKHNFICFDIVEFYPSISKELLNKALDFASKYDAITTDERNIIIHAKHSLLYDSKHLWQKKGPDTFDVTMGSYDGAETCELVGCFLLSQLQEKYGNKIGLYRDDGLAVTDTTPRETEKIKKGICQIFKTHGLNITIEANKQIVNFLDVTFNLTDKTYRPYTKPSSTLLYVHRESNHPPTVIKNIPAGINRRLSSISSDKKSFDLSAQPYQKALDESGYNHKLEFDPQASNKRKNRPRKNILWYNPPFSKNVSNNIGKRFLSLVDKCFPEGHNLRPIFNRNTIKISYSCMSNIKQIIDCQNKHNQMTDNNNTPECENTKTCNCRKKDTCPLSGNCLQSAVIYQAKVTRKDNDTHETYVGLTENDFKTRYRNHTSSFRNASSRNSTELSKHIWQLKDKNIDHKITWRILARARPYSNASKRCNLCLMEKFIIICKTGTGTLNRRNELVSSCRHRIKSLQRNN